MLASFWKLLLEVWSAAMAKSRRRFDFARFSCFGGQARTKKMAEDGHPVKLHVYDLSQGMARQLSTTFLGKAIEEIWHTGVVVYGREYYFGGGIQQGQPGRTPVRVVDLGVTHVPREVFEDFLREIGPRYTPATYNLLSHNCNNFSNEAVQFLAGTSIPGYILELPHEIMKSPVGALILPMIQGLEASLRAGAVPQPSQFRPAPAAAATTTRQPLSDEVAARATGASKQEADKTVGRGNGSTLPPAAPAPAASAAHPSSDEVVVERSTDNKAGNNGSSSEPDASGRGLGGSPRGGEEAGAGGDQAGVRGHHGDRHGAGRRGGRAAGHGAARRAARARVATPGELITV